LAADGAQALSAYAQGDYAMVITDCAMPVLDGVVLMRSIRQRERAAGRHTILVALTADATPAQRDISLDAGADEVFVKPLSLEQLRLLLTRYRLLDAPSAGLPEAGAAEALWPQLRRTLAADMDALLAFASAGELERMRDVAHQIAGTAAWFQLEEVAQAAARMEEESAKPEAVQAAIVALKEAIDRAIAPAHS
jgi:CheY-like chemotaxis protein